MRGTTTRLPGLVLTEHRFRVPLDHDRPGGPPLELFAREAVAAERVADELPWLVFLQGGPGGAAPRPVTRDSWLGRAVQQYRVLLLDQRGTGRSSPVTRQTLPRPAAAADPAGAQADYLMRFRADSIVRDAELVRRELLGAERWLALGQSFGGFCTTTYLSLAPEGLSGAALTGGLPGLTATADEVHRRTYRRVIDRNDRYYERYPGDVAAVRRVVEVLTERPARLPDGDLLSVPRLQVLGRVFGMSDGFETVHYLFETAFADEGRGELSDGFLCGVADATGFATHPLYPTLLEACYGAPGAPTNWSAQRLLAEFPEFSATADRLAFTGEMVYRWMFEEQWALRPFAAAVDALAGRTDWPALYDPSRLAGNEVPTVAAVYHDDMYVDVDLSLQSAAAVRGSRVWLTNQYQHDGLRKSGEDVLGRLLDMLGGLT